jgi:hypothetical protein
MHATRALCCLLALATVASAQVVGIDDLDPVTGTVNAFPFNTTTGGNTSLHVYSVQALRARGLCAGAVLLDIAVAPASGTAGTYNAPQALLQIGHLSVSPPVPGAWTTHLASPITIHGISSGPYSFPWALNTHHVAAGHADDRLRVGRRARLRHPLLEFARRHRVVQLPAIRHRAAPLCDDVQCHDPGADVPTAPSRWRSS